MDHNSATTLATGFLFRLLNSSLNGESLELQHVSVANVQASTHKFKNFMRLKMMKKLLTTGPI